jgi:hypothetical protein
MGTDPVSIDLGGMTLSTQLWEGWYFPAGSWSALTPVAGGATVTAGPGWTLDLPFAHGLPLGPDRTLHVAVNVPVVVRGNQLIAGLRHAPVPLRGA